MDIIQKISTSAGLRKTANGQESSKTLGQQNQDINPQVDDLFDHMLAVMAAYPQLIIDDYDLPLIREQLIVPVVQYLANSQRISADSKGVFPHTPPIFVSGEPGIGKTTLLMILDEALCQSGQGSSRSVVESGEIAGYFADKGILPVTPLRLFGSPTSALSARDWNNLLRHWTYDESTYRESQQAVAHLLEQLRGKVVILDEAELEGYVYFTETLARNGILVLLSSNLGGGHIHLTQQYRAVTLRGRDHREGDIANVCLPNIPRAFFEMLAGCDPIKVSELAGAACTGAIIDGKRVVALNWPDLRDQPLMKDDFAHFFRNHAVDFVVIDSVPFFAPISDEAITLTFLGHLSRFVNFVDAIHDCRLPLLVRGTHLEALDNQDVSRDLRASLQAFDARMGSNHGQAAWAEWSRCLSRLRSREAFNTEWAAEHLPSESYAAVLD